MTDEPSVYTVEEAAKLLRVSRSTMYEGCRTGAVACVKLGRVIRIPRRAIQALLNEEERAADVKVVRL